MSFYSFSLKHPRGFPHHEYLDQSQELQEKVKYNFSKSNSRKVGLVNRQLYIKTKASLHVHTSSFSSWYSGYLYNSFISRTSLLPLFALERTMAIVLPRYEIALWSVQEVDVDEENDAILAGYSKKSTAMYPTPFAVRGELSQGSSRVMYRLLRPM